MKTTVQIVFAFLAASLILSSACNKNDKSEKPGDSPCTAITIDKSKSNLVPLTLIKEGEVKIDSPGYPSIVNVDQEGCVLIKVGEKNTRFLEYDAQLALVNSREIRYGEGPNECLQVLAMGSDDSHILIYDGMMQSYYRYDSTLKTREKVGSKPYRRGWVPHGVNFFKKHNTFVTSFFKIMGTSDYMKYWLYFKQLEGNQLKSTERFITKNRFITKDGIFYIGKPFHFCASGDFLYLLYKEDYRIQKIAMDGTVVGCVKVTGLPKISFSKQERGDWVESAMIRKHSRKKFTFPEYLYHANWVVPIGDGIAVGRIKDYKPVEKEWVQADYFDRNLAHLGSIKLPWFPSWNYPSQIQAGLFFYSKGDYLYFIDARISDTDEEYWLTRWRIDYGKN